MGTRFESCVSCALLMLVGVTVFAGGCGEHGGEHEGNGHGDHAMLPPALEMIEVAPHEGALELPVLADEDPAEGVVEVTLVARPGEVELLSGVAAEVWTYNGTLPGPTIEAQVGDELVVHFTNELPEATTIHWHGVRVPATMDGTTAMAQPIEPGESFEYRFRLEDSGTFWFHPHVRSDVQVEKGLYGVLVVRDPSEPALPVVSDEMLVLDDVRVDPATGALDEQVDERAQMMGREGNLVLVNGKPANLEPRRSSIGSVLRARQSSRACAATWWWPSRRPCRSSSSRWARTSSRRCTMGS